jgi:hypothetical protein
MQPVVKGAYHIEKQQFLGGVKQVKRPLWNIGAPAQFIYGGFSYTELSQARLELPPSGGF